MQQFFNNIFNIIFPAPTLNGFYGQSEAGYIYVYFVVICIILGVLLFQRLRTPEVSDKRKKTTIFYVLMISVFFIVMLQTFVHANYYLYLYSQPVSPDMQKKKVTIFGFPYVFAMQSKESFSGSCRARLITDIDITQEEGMTEHRTLAYFLYPINLRVYNQSLAPECIVYYKKERATDLVPKDFSVKYKFDEKNLLAVRKGI